MKRSKKKVGFRSSYILLSILPFMALVLSRKYYWAFHILLLGAILLDEKVIARTANYAYLFLLGIPLLWATLFSFKNDARLVLQALFYLTTPFVFTFIGMQIGRITSKRLVLQYIVYSGTVGAVYYVVVSFYTLGIKIFGDPYAMREIMWWGSITSVAAIFIVLFSEKHGIILFKRKWAKHLIVAVNACALYFTASRTYYLVFLIFLFVFLSGYKRRLAVPLGLVYALTFVVLLNSSIDNKLIAKIRAVPIETDIGEYFSEAEINTQYRGHETYMALKTYASGGPVSLLLGHGLEKQVDLGAYVKLGESYRRIIPVLHNGYVYLLLKEGLLGLLFFMGFLLYIFRLKGKDRRDRLSRHLIVASAISLLVSNVVIGTFFSVEMSIVWVLFGVYMVQANRAKATSIWNNNRPKLCRSPMPASRCELKNKALPTS